MKTERRVSNKEAKYLSWQRSDITWRQFWQEIQGKEPLWMHSTQYGGEWLDKKMNEPL